jgi:hypothetical protein
MAEIVDLQATRQRRNAPDANCVSEDAQGKAIQLFAVEFHMDGRTFADEIWARDLADAERTVVAIRDSLRVVGEMVAKL